MIYLSGVQALNIENSLNTCGDWHQTAIQWDKLKLKESNDSIFKDWGIELDKKVPDHTEHYAVANDLRAILDLMVDGQTRWLKGFSNDFICTDEYNEIFFEQVIKLKGLPNWDDINKLMQNEFMWDWDRFVKEHMQS